MGGTSYYFNGATRVSPGTFSYVDDSALTPAGTTTGNLACIMGTSTGGEPNTLLTFTDPDKVVATLGTGLLAQAVMRAFNPSDDTGGPASVACIRVNPAVQSTLTLKDASGNAVITLTSADWGAWTAKLKVSVGAGSTAGLKLSTAYGTTVYTQDNLNVSPFSVQYTGGAASATMTITNETVTLFAPAGTQVASIDLNTFSTIEELVDSINVVADFAATVTSGYTDATALNGLDSVTAVDIATQEYSALANLQAVVDYFNGSSQPYVTAARVSGAGSPPAAISYQYLTGGSDGVTTTSSWDASFSALQLADVQWITPISSDPAIHAMADAHVQYMSTTGKKERRAICGTPLSTSDTAAIALAKAINSNRTSLIHLGHYSYDLTGATSDLVLWAPYITAAAMAGAFSAVDPGTPLTNKAFNFTGLERDLNDPGDTDPLLEGGVVPFENTSAGYKCTQSITTWLTSTAYDKVEQSVGFAADYCARTLRTAIDPVRGGKNGPLLMGDALQRAESALRAMAVPAPNGPGVLVGDADNPAYQNLTVALVDDYITVSVQAAIVLPCNYVGITIAAVPYSGSVSA